MTFDGWIQSHNCVTAVALETMKLLPQHFSNTEIEKAVFCLLARQHADGYWESYWWRSKMFATSIIVEFLASSGIPEAKSAARKGHSWISTQIRPSGYADNGYDAEVPCIVSTALSIRPLYHIPSTQGICRKCANWLLDQQLPDGSWKSKPILQIPPPNLVNPNSGFPWKFDGRGVGSCSADKNRIYTTSTVVAALSSLGDM